MAPLTAVKFGDNLPGYEGGDKTAPAVIVVQEWWGITEVVKKQAEVIAAEGFRVLVPDLYKGKLGVNAEEAAHLMNNLDFQGAVKEIGQAAAYLKQTGSPKVGIVGFCMGGALCFASAQHVADLACTAPCYGIPDARYFQIDQIKIPICGTFAGKDGHKGFSAPEDVAAAEEKLKAGGCTFDFKTFPNGVHGFLNQVIKPEGEQLVKEHQGGTLAPDNEVQEAWQRVLAFLNKSLK